MKSSYIAKEIYTTEKAYVESLCFVMEVVPSYPLDFSALLSSPFPLRLAIPGRDGSEEHHSKEGARHPVFRS